MYHGIAIEYILAEQHIATLSISLSTELCTTCEAHMGNLESQTLGRIMGLHTLAQAMCYQSPGMLVSI